jgi:hypothetical protein
VCFAHLAHLMVTLQQVPFPAQPFNAQQMKECPTMYVFRVQLVIPTQPTTTPAVPTLCVTLNPVQPTATISSLRVNVFAMMDGPVRLVSLGPMALGVAPVNESYVLISPVLLHRMTTPLHHSNLKTLSL